MNPKWWCLLFLKTLLISEIHGREDDYSFQCMNKNITRNKFTDNCSCITSNEIKTTKLFKCKCESAGTDRTVWMEFVCTHSFSKDSNLKTVSLENIKSTNEVYLNRSCISLVFSKGVPRYRIVLFCRGYGLGVVCKCNAPVDNELGQSVSSNDLTLSDNGNPESPLMSWNDREKRDVDDVVNTTQISVETTAQNNKMTTKLMTSILSKGSTDTTTVRKTQTTKQGRNTTKQGRTLSHLTAKTSQYVATTTNELAVTSQKAQASHQNTIITTNSRQVLSTESEFTSETENTTKQIGVALPKSKKGGSAVAIAVGVIVPILILTIIGVVVYKWYRRKYPVRMVLGKNFSKFQNPVYNKKTSTLSLVRSVPYDAPYSGTDKNGGHDNPALDMEYRDLQPVSFSTNYDDAESITEIDEVPKKPPRSKKRVSVMSTESTDGRVMSAFLQEAINEADSESDTTNESNKIKKKITVDVDMRKNVSRVSVESIESENDLHTSDEESNDEQTYENITISSKKEIKNSVPDESIVETKSSDDEDNYEEVETVRTEKNLSDENEDYDIVNVDESETNTASQIIDKTTDQVENSDNSDADYENFEMRSENHEEGISIGVIQLDETDGNEIHSPFVEGGKKKKVKVTFEENEILASDEESIASIDLSAVKDETDIETNNSGSGRSENNQNDFIETPKVIKVSEMPLLLQPLAKSESRPVPKAISKKEKRTIAPDQSDVREKIAVNQNNPGVVSDDSESENDTDSHKSDDAGINQTYLHTHEDSTEPIVKSVGTSDSSENGSMDEFENMNETIGKHESKENDNNELAYIPPLPNIPPPDIQNFQSRISSDYVITETPNDVADASSGDESASFSYKRQEQINADSRIFETTSIPSLPLTKPPPTFEQNSASSDSFEILNGTNILTTDNITVFEDSILNVDSDNKSDLSENPPTPPIPGSPPPIFQQNQPEFPYDSFTVMAKPGDIHTDDQSQTKNLGSPMDDTDDEYDVLSNDDLIPVSSDPDELMPGSSYVTSVNPQLVTKNEEGSDVISISDTNSEPGEYEKPTDTALSSSTMNAEVEQRFSKVISSPKINFYDAETSTKVIASPKINFDDSDSDSGKSDTNSESSV
ncbi:dentin sialophosphoprotein-like [Mytilus trossulus]|uniref:dentin sialophosphoprotein-like n=1 Tax=Mytilus trossulus TaxID=6551 RepID=UPI00300761B4